jgi:hypothetical protein
LIGIHSFWSKPLLNARWGEQGSFEKSLYLTALSLKTMKRVFGRVELVTDSEGAKLLEGLDYDAVHLDLDHLRDTNPRYWSAGKVLALRRYDVPVTHVDGDVFFLKEEIKTFFDSPYDSIVQMKEVGSHYSKTYTHLIEMMKPALFNWDLDTYSFAYNCGVMGFKNVEFMHYFVEEYFRALRACEKKQAVIDGISGIYEINIVLEQCLLTHLAQNKNLHVKELLTIEKQTFPGLQTAAEEIGFVHLWGKSKYEKKWQQKVESKLLELDPDTYYKLKK